VTRTCTRCGVGFEVLGAARELCPACLRDEIPACGAADLSGRPCGKWTEAGQVFCLEHLEAGFSLWNKAVLGVAHAGERMTGPESRPGRSAAGGLR